MKRITHYARRVWTEWIFLEPMLTYQDLKYDSTELEKLGPFSNINAQDDIELTEKGYVASVSFPISF